MSDSDAFIDSVQRQHDALGQFNQLLAREQALLTASPLTVDALAQLTERKAAQASELDTLDRQRQSILSERGYSTNRAGAEKMAEELGCQDLWQALVERVEAARTQIQINGEVIDHRLDLTTRTLGYLQRATGQTLYGPNGRTRAAYGGSHSIRSGV